MRKIYDYNGEIQDWKTLSPSRETWISELKPKNTQWYSESKIYLYNILMWLIIALTALGYKLFW